jgi:transposase
VTSGNPDELVTTEQLAAAARADFASLSHEELLDRAVSMYVELIQMQVLVERLTARMVELEKKIGKSGPPPFVKPNTPQKPAGSKQKQKRKPRPHAFSRKRLEPTDTTYHVFEHCPDCSRHLTGGWTQRVRQIIDLPETKAKVTDHVVLGRYCGVCRKGCIPKLELWDEVVGQSTLGINLMSLIGHLRNACNLPVRSIRSLLQTIYGLSISTGTIVAALHAIAARGADTLKSLLDHVRGSPVKHGDETGWREDGQNGYLWSFSTPTVRYLVYDRSRAGSVPQEVLGDEVQGTLVCDFYGGYNATRCLRQRCWVHFLRDLHKLKVAFPERTDVVDWVDRVITLYREAADFQQACLAAPHADAYSVLARRDRRREFESRLSWLAAPYVDLAKGENRPPQSVLAERCERFSAELFTFIELPDVPSHNNPAEQAIRPSVVARKISGGTRSEKGSATRAANMSLFGTWQLQKLNPMAECAKMLQSAAPA